MASVAAFFQQPWIAYAVGILAALILPTFSRLTTGSWIKGLMLGADGKLSTSKAQFWIWTEVVVFAYAFLFTSHVQGGNLPWPGGNGPMIPTDVMILMGLSVTTAATAKGLAAANPGSTAAGGTATAAAAPVGGAGGAGAAPAAPLTSGTSDAKYGDLVTDNQSGTVTSFSKAQMLTWSIVAAVAYIATTVAARASFFGATATAYPDIDPALVVLVGLGQGAYLGTKVAARNGTDV
ncbi:MAG: hypothetical protein JO103_08300 [Candidatus Eremiobacteraeota bacterium]|nr:hypothetical protein [Candidatus Eremiobacteraeota bacterium]MBV9407974.1 hypothetical protein [Candidatus Eremiobacteraeota bacterium]